MESIDEVAARLSPELEAETIRATAIMDFGSAFLWGIEDRAVSTAYLILAVNRP